MYAILKNDNSIGDFETRDLPISELVHKDLAYLYIEINESDDLKIGDIYDEVSKTWIKIEHEEVVGVIDVPIPVITNAELAQLISDLQADLIIAGVL